jgi:hypothetical protein
MAATIVTPDGKKYPLWTNNKEPVIANRNDGGGEYDVGLRALSFLSEIVVEVQLALMPTIKATLTPPFREAIALMDSTILTWGVNTLEVQFGYVSDTTSNTVLSPVYSGILMKPEVTFGTDITITLNAVGVSGLAASTQSGTRTFNFHTRLQIIEHLAKGTIQDPRKQGEKTQTEGLNATTVDPIDESLRAQNPETVIRSPRTGIAGLIGTVFNKAAGALVATVGKPTRNVEVNIDAIKDDSELLKALTGEPRLPYVQGGRTDWQSIREICDEIGCVFVMEGRNLKIIPRNYTKKTTRHFRLFDYPNGGLYPAQGEFPILSASSPTMAMFLPGASRGVVVRGIDPDTKEPKTVNINDSTEKSSRTSDGGATPADGEVFAGTDDSTGDGQSTMPGDPSDTDAINKGKSEFQKMSHGMGVNLTIESLADPNLFPGDMIEARGLGWRFSGSYVVFKTTHTFGGSGSTMSLECFSNAGKVESMIKAQGATAKQTEPQIEDDAVTVEPVEQA